MTSLVTQQPEKFPDYRMERDQLYSRMGTVPEEEDETPRNYKMAENIAFEYYRNATTVRQLDI